MEQDFTCKEFGINQLKLLSEQQILLGIVNINLK